MMCQREGQSNKSVKRGEQTDTSVESLGLQLPSLEGLHVETIGVLLRRAHGGQVSSYEVVLIAWCVGLGSFVFDLSYIQPGEENRRKATPLEVRDASRADGARRRKERVVS